MTKYVDTCVLLFTISFSKIDGEKRENSQTCTHAQHPTSPAYSHASHSLKNSIDKKLAGHYVGLSLGTSHKIIPSSTAYSPVAAFILSLPFLPIPTVCHSNHKQHGFRLHRTNLHGYVTRLQHRWSINRNHHRFQYLERIHKRKNAHQPCWQKI